MKNILLFCSALALSVPAWAEPFTYGPENCEFQITFPEKPFIEKKCAENINDCTEVVSYTKAIGAEGSTNFRVTCNPVSADDVEKYTPDIIKETLNQLIKANNMTTFNSEARVKDGYKTASAISLTEKDGKPVIYNGQIWVGKKSMFTIEAEIRGKSDKVDEVFADILRKTYPKDKPPQKEDQKQEKAK